MIKNVIDRYTKFVNLDSKTRGILDFHFDIIPAQYIYYFSFGYDYPNLTYKYYYRIKKLWEYKGKLKEILKYYYISDAFYKLYQLINKGRPSELDSLIKEELLTKRLKEEVLAGK